VCIRPDVHTSTHSGPYNDLAALPDARCPTGATISLLLGSGTLLVLVGHVDNGAAEGSRRAGRASDQTVADPGPSFGSGGAPRARVHAKATLRGDDGPRRMLHAHEMVSYGATCDAAEQRATAEFDCSELSAPSAEFCEDPLFGGDRRCCYETYGVARAAGTCNRCPSGAQDCVQAKTTCSRRLHTQHSRAHACSCPCPVPPGLSVDTQTW